MYMMSSEYIRVNQALGSSQDSGDSKAWACSHSTVAALIFLLKLQNPEMPNQHSM